MPAASHVEPALRFLNSCLALDISLPHLATAFQRRQTTVVALWLAWFLTALAWTAGSLPASVARAGEPGPILLEPREEIYVPTLPVPGAAAAFLEQEDFFLDIEPIDPDILLAQKIQDPAIETVDEMTARPAGSGGRSGARSGAGEWWDSIRDPAIRTVDEQTRDTGKKDDKKKGDDKKKKDEKKMVRPDQHPGLHAVSHQQRALE